MTLAERIHAKIEKGAHGVLFWIGVRSRAQYVAKRLTYTFADGSRLIRDHVDTENESVQADWPARVTDGDWSEGIKADGRFIRRD